MLNLFYLYLLQKYFSKTAKIDFVFNFLYSF